MDKKIETLIGYRLVGVLDTESFSVDYANVDLELAPLDKITPTAKTNVGDYKRYFYELNEDGKYVSPKSDLCSLSLSPAEELRIHNLPPHVTVKLEKADDLPDAIPFVKEVLHHANLLYTEAERLKTETYEREEAERQRQIGILKQVDRDLRFPSERLYRNIKSHQ